MNICPRCGLPFDNTFPVETQLLCDYCGWSGSSNSTLFTGSEKFEGEELVKLRRLFIKLAKDISPQIMRALIKEGFFKADASEVPRMVPVLSSTTRAMFSALVTALCERAAQAQGVGDDGKAIHPQAQ